MCVYTQVFAADGPWRSRGISGLTCVRWKGAVGSRVCQGCVSVLTFSGCHAPADATPSHVPSAICSRVRAAADANNVGKAWCSCPSQATVLFITGVYANPCHSIFICGYRQGRTRREFRWERHNICGCGCSRSACPYSKPYS